MRSNIRQLITTLAVAVVYLGARSPVMASLLDFSATHPFLNTKHERIIA